jgi:CTP-dependent riboflavin kinase
VFKFDTIKMLQSQSKSGRGIAGDFTITQPQAIQRPSIITCCLKRTCNSTLFNIRASKAKPLTIELSGEVASGHGEGRKYLEFAWVQKQMSEKLGFNPYPGTLNLRLGEESVKRRKLLKENAVFKVCANGFCTGLLFKASIDNVSCGVVIPQVENYPDNELELVAAVNLREKLLLCDGDEVAVKVFV